MQNKSSRFTKSSNKNLGAIITAVFLTLTLGACAFPGVYKINVQQGNIITQDMLSQLQTGMTKRQIHFVLGTPIARNVFSDKYESYIYSYQPADGELQQQVINVYYQNGVFTHYEGEPLEEHPAY